MRIDTTRLIVGGYEEFEGPVDIDITVPITPETEPHIRALLAIHRRELIIKLQATGSGEIL